MKKKSDKAKELAALKKEFEAANNICCARRYGARAAVTGSSRTTWRKKRPRALKPRI